MERNSKLTLVRLPIPIKPGAWAGSSRRYFGQHWVLQSLPELLWESPSC